MTNDEYSKAVKRNSQRIYMTALSFTMDHAFDGDGYMHLENE